MQSLLLLQKDNAVIMDNNDFEYSRTTIPQHKSINYYIFGMHFVRIFNFKNCCLSSSLEFYFKNH